MGRDGLPELPGRGFLLGRRGGLDELHHEADVIDLLLERYHGADCSLERVQPRDVLLRTLGVVPEPGCAHLGLQRLDFPLLLIYVKETSTSALLSS